MRSIMTDNLEQCYYCGTTEDVELHHCIHGNKHNRSLATQYHLLIGCCSYHHRSINGIHGKYGKEKDLKLQAEAQLAWEKRRVKKGKSEPDTVRDEWMAIFNKDYVKEFEEYVEECKRDLVTQEPDEKELKKLLSEINE